MSSSTAQRPMPPSDHQKIHPVDVEARPHLLRSPRPPRQCHGRTRRPFIALLTTARSPSLILLIVIVAATIGILYLVLDPKLPKYSVDRLRITDFSVDSGLNARASFNLTVTAKNPNKHIGIYYEDNSHLSVWYSDISLCEGSFPVFYQGHRNTTVMTVTLSGQTKLGSDVVTALRAQQQTGKIPLKFRGDVPVKVKLGGLKLWKVTSRVRCDLVVDSLNANNQISIKTSDCKFSLKL
ncbi:uncharacterized protein A4U43_C07F22180 [Asparagus officinalis]|uniref:Late embryogenesis abundant protein LEA-2 subgroup domain-containing protein n=1 Tax=Asparagus officinalis TaxID=4686 RepID=A0A5P1EJ61_ASPOF|nr:uncharacterized protein A4U43_C07F22180 [Asparagus officinalis]